MKTKAIIFDFDGTLTKPHRLPNSWARVWDRIGCKDIDDLYYGQYLNGEISYTKWLDLCYDCFKENKVNEKDFFEISNEIELVDNLEEYFKYLNGQNIKIYILSGGVGNIIEEKTAPLKKYITSIEADKFLIDEKGYLCGVQASESRIETKSHFVKSLMANLGLNHDEVVFVGNGANDEEVYTSGVKTICVNPDKNAHPNNKIFWTEYLEDCLDIMKTLNFIE